MFQISENWLKTHSSKTAEILEQIEEATARKFPGGAHMLTGFSQGRLLALISNLIKPRRILEIGTFTGYSCLCLAEGMPEDGCIYTIEKSAQYAEVATDFFSQTKYYSRIKLLTGHALEILNEIHENWDLIYLDADKSANRDYLKILWPDLRPEGLILIDNVFSRGAVLKKENDQRNFEKEVCLLNKDIPSLFPDGEQFILPIRDGLSILRKLA